MLARYKTTKKHGKYPAGTICWAARGPDHILRLGFDDGNVIELAPDFYARGLESSGHFVQDEDDLVMRTLDMISSDAKAKKKRK